MSKVKVPADSESGEGSLPGLQAAFFSLSPHMVEGTGCLWGLTYKSPDSITSHRPYLSIPSHL